jgi:hypothetical protein
MTRFMPMRAGTYQISSPFGNRGGGMHWGTDFAATDGTNIYAAQAGTVVHIGKADGFGQWIVIDHPEEAGSGTTVYGHMWDALATGLRQGDQVSAGQHIAFVGNNGESSGSHVHFEVHPTVWQPRTQLDPMPWLAGALEPGEAVPVGEPRREPVREPQSDHDILVEIYDLLTKPLSSRSIYRDSDNPVDNWRGMVLNIDGMAHEAYIEREALLGYDPAIAIVRRCAENNADALARGRAAFILAKIAERAGEGPAGNGEARRPAVKAPAKKAAKGARKASGNR